MKLNRINPASLTATKLFSAMGRINDGGGLALLPNYKSKPERPGGPVVPSGIHRWIFRSTLGGKAFEMGLGTLAEVPLATARTKAVEARQAVGRGEDPRAERQAAKTAPRPVGPVTFRAFAESLIKRQAGMRSARVTARWTADFDNHVWNHATFKDRAIVDIKRAEIQTYMDEFAGGDSVRVLMFKRICAVFESARNQEAIPANTALGLEVSGYTKRNQPAVRTPKALREVFASFDAYSSEIMRIAFDLQAYLFQRPYITASAEWTEIDLTAAVWTVPGAKMKRDIEDKINGGDHIVHLPRQVVAILETLRPLTGAGRFLFPKAGDAQSHMPADSINDMMQTALGRTMEAPWEAFQTAHGFRSVAISMGEEYAGLNKDALDLISGHKIGDKLGTAYARARQLARRRRAIRAYADWLDAVRAGEAWAFIEADERAEQAAEAAKAAAPQIDPAQYAEFLAWKAMQAATAQAMARQAA